MARLDPTGVSRILSYIKNWVTAALGGKANSSHNHTKSQITDFPTIPSNTSQLTNDSGYITSSGSCNYANSAGSAGSATTAETVSTSVADGSVKDVVYAYMAGSDAFRIRCGGSGDNGYVEIATSDNGNEPIYVRQYNIDGGNIGDFATIARTLTLLDGSGNTQFPGTVSAPTFSGNLNGSCSGTAGGVAWDNVSGKPSAFTPYFANGTWYAVGDDAAIGDHNVGGGLGVKALNSTTTRIDFCYKDDASNYKSITFDGTTLYVNGNCDYATSAGSCNYANSAGSSSIAIRDSGGTWISGRDNAVVKQTRHSTEDGNSWNPAVSVKTKSGNWTIGTVGYDKLQFSYDTDEDYNTGNNRNTVVELNPESGTIITSANIGSQSVNYANSSNYANSAGSVVCNVPAESFYTPLGGDMAANDAYRIRAGGTNNGGELWIETADDGNEPIGFAQYTGYFSSVARYGYLLNSSGDTEFPGTLFTSRGAIITRNGIPTPGWGMDANTQSVLQIRTTDNTEPSLCFHRSGYSHVVLGEQNNELVTHGQGGTPSRINHDGWTTLNGYRIYVG